MKFRLMFAALAVGLGLMAAANVEAANIPQFCGPTGVGPTGCIPITQVPIGQADLNALVNQINTGVTSATVGPASAPRNILQSADPSKNGYSTGATTGTISSSLSATYVGAPNLWFAAGLSPVVSMAVSKAGVNQLSLPSGQTLWSVVQRTSGQTATSYIFQGQELPTKNFVALAGQPMFCHFNAIAGANFSAAGNNVTWNLVTGTGTDEGTSKATISAATAAGGNWLGWTGAAVTATGTQAITTSANRYVTPTFVIPTTATEALFEIGFVPTGTAGTSDLAGFGQVQCEVGFAPPTATQTVFERQELNQVQADEAWQVQCPVQESTSQTGTVLVGAGSVTNGSTTAGTVGVALLGSSMRTVPSFLLSSVGSLEVFQGSTAISATSVGIAPVFGVNSISLPVTVAAGLSDPVGHGATLQIGTSKVVGTGQYCVGTPF